MTSRARRPRGRATAPPAGAALAAGLLLAGAGRAEAHAGGAALVLLLPTPLYLAGGALAVGLSFLLTALLPPRRLEQAAAWRRDLPLPAAAAVAGRAAGGVALAAALVLVTAGVAGSRDPLANPLPLALWSLWWVGLTLVQAAAGDAWRLLEPWTALHRLLTVAPPLTGWRRAAPLAYPRRAAHWPAVLFLLGFAWLELIHPAPADPAVLAGVVAGYLVVHAIGRLLFGEDWLGRAEPFTVLFGLLARLAPLGRAAPGASGPVLELTLPGARLLRPAPADASLAAFVVLVLSIVSFDGLSRSFAWLAWLGENPLLYPGRTALMGRNSLGLLALWAVLGAAFLGAVALGRRLAGGGPTLPGLLGGFALALVPVACGYHLAHYLPALLVDGQHALRALSDPFARGWDLVGTRDRPVVVSLLTDPARAYPIWHLQVAAMVAGHLAGVLAAHVAGRRLWGERGRALAGGLPLVALMIGYTLLGLWLLSTPAV